MRTVSASEFESWRVIARELLSDEVEPKDVQWIDAAGPAPQRGLQFNEPPPAEAVKSVYRVPPRFVSLARLVACHRNSDRWNRLYRVLWRLTHGEAELLSIAVDDDTHQLMLWEKAIRRDEHKMHAFVRFQCVPPMTKGNNGSTAAEEHYVAWYQPDHRIVRLAAPFFVERFVNMRWSILTPEESVLWDKCELRFGPGVPRAEIPSDDEVVGLWQSYYSSIFNPARLNVKTMLREMPRRFWQSLPEAELIPQLVEAAPQRTLEFLERSMPQHTSAAEFLPERHSIKALREAATNCQGCDLYANATQTVFGEGPAKAKLVFVGEQPGDTEDVEGHPFIGPAGKLFDSVLAEVGIARSEVYVTNAVKHFKWEPRGKRRLHAKPNAREINACRPWLEAELKTIKPAMLVCLGATAAQALLGRTFKITQQRGKVVASPWSSWTFATYHPSAVLRAKASSDGERIYNDFQNDLRVVAEALAKLR